MSRRDRIAAAISITYVEKAPLSLTPEEMTQARKLTRSGSDARLWPLFMEARQSKRRSIVELAFEGQTLVGWVLVMNKEPENSMESSNWFWDTMGFVRRDKRRLGIGTELFRRAEAWIKRNKGKGMRTYPNQQTKKFFQFIS